MTTLGNTPKDLELPSPPGDGISSLSFSPKANFLVSGSWDVSNQVRCWEVNGAGANPKAAMSHDAPVLCTAWSSDGQSVFSGACDGKAKMWSLGTGQSQQIGQHAGAIKSMAWVDQLNCLVTASWDKTLKFWDGKSPNPVHTTQLPERVYCMDIRGSLGVVATANREVLIYDIKNPANFFKKIPSPLKYQSRTIACFIDQSGFAIGSSEGRVGIQYIQDSDSAKNFAFKCHRVNTVDVYAVNQISMHPQWGTFSTCGSDGTFTFWDKDSKQRLKQFPQLSQPISATAWNADGSIFAYAVSYDWHKVKQGSEYYNPNVKPQIFIHPTPESEIKNRAAKR
ncbi:hypothetical protein PROFUN_04115 [Planoprotostelium fungivorum]|uniref:Uncharacterized protein n=1 Tax=Planoprotostelium fungivorum TaxID=1890364 RepID=A0A2P6NJK7_9EUKA|nr:hypothetical protein PROFUN_14078 [Planoprotostelium fungivorum]PRP84124.1 hypothetical protein PROFUN_04115 [Planoprotostelium fungivorum]